MRYSYNHDNCKFRIALFLRNSCFKMLQRKLFQLCFGSKHHAVVFSPTKLSSDLTRSVAQLSSVVVLLILKGKRPDPLGLAWQFTAHLVIPNLSIVEHLELRG